MLGWEPVAAARPDDDGDVIRAHLGPPPTRRDIEALSSLLDEDEDDHERAEENLSWHDPASSAFTPRHAHGETVQHGGPAANSPAALRKAMWSGSGADALAHATGATAGAPWPLPAEGELPIGVGPTAGGETVDVGALARQHVDGQTMVALEQLQTEQVDAYTLVEAIAAWGRIESLAAYHKRLLAHELARRPQAPSRTGHLPPNEASRPVASAEIAFRLGATRQHARTLIDAGAAMTDGAGMIAGDALRAGVINAAKADLLIERTNHLPGELALAVQDEVLTGGGPMRTLPQMRRAVERAVAKVDPEGFAERHNRARRARCVSAPQILPDGMANTRITWSAVDAIAFHTALESAARTAKSAGDERTLANLRADAVATMAHTALASGHIGPCPTCTSGHDTTDTKPAPKTEAPSTSATTADVDRAPRTDQPAQPRVSADGNEATGGNEDASGTASVNTDDPCVAQNGNPTGNVKTHSEPSASEAAETPANKARASNTGTALPDGDQPGSEDCTGESISGPALVEHPRSEHPSKHHGEPNASEPQAAGKPPGSHPHDPGEHEPAPRGPDPDEGVEPGDDAEQPQDVSPEAATCTHSQIRLTPFPLGTVGGAKAQIRITVPLSALMGADEEAADLEGRSEEHTSELQSRGHLVCRLLLE